MVCTSKFENYCIVVNNQRLLVHLLIILFLSFSPTLYLLSLGSFLNLLFSFPFLFFFSSLFFLHISLSFCFSFYLIYSNSTSFYSCYCHHLLLFIFFFFWIFILIFILIQFYTEKLISSIFCLFILDAPLERKIVLSFNSSPYKFLKFISIQDSCFNFWIFYWLHLIFSSWRIIKIKMSNLCLLQVDIFLSFFFFFIILTIKNKACPIISSWDFEKEQNWK